MNAWILLLISSILHHEIGGTPTLLAVPKNETEILKLLTENPGHEGLALALQSVRNNRSATDAYIIVLGLSGAGKSSTINRLVQGILTPSVSSGNTDSIQEYVLPVPLPKLGISNAKLHIIDTPEYEFGGGQNLLTSLLKFRRDHSELNTRLPTSVLILSRFDDNRASGENSKFTKMLKAFDSIKEGFVPSTGHSNVIFLLTRLMSETKAVTRRPQDRIKFFENIIRNFTQFPPPITVKVGENNGDVKGLSFVNGSFELPNGEDYPENVITSMIQSATNNQDLMGAKILEYLLGDAGGESKFNFGKVQTITHRLVNTNTTTMDYDFDQLEADLTKRFESIQQNLNRMRTLLERRKTSVNSTAFKGEVDKFLSENCPSSPPRAHPVVPLVVTPSNVSNSCQVTPIMTDGSRSCRKAKLLDVTLNVVGQSYDLLRDTVMEATPYLYPPRLILKWKQNYNVDPEIKVDILTNPDCPVTFHQFETKKDYLKHRFQTLDSTTAMETDFMDNK